MKWKCPPEQLENYMVSHIQPANSHWSLSENEKGISSASVRSGPRFYAVSFGYRHHEKEKRGFAICPIFSFFLIHELSNSLDNLRPGHTESDICRILRFFLHPEQRLLTVLLTLRTHSVVVQYSGILIR